MLELSTIGWIVAAFCALTIGLSKTGVPGAGILVVPLLAGVMPAKLSTGFLLPMLCAADLMAIVYWRRHVDWRKLLALLPCSLAGVGIGYCLLDRISSQVLMLIIGVIVLTLLGMTARQSYAGIDGRGVPKGWWFVVTMGLLAGATTMLANAAGPIMIIYLLAMRLKKEQFIGTGAWYFWIVNLIKIPLSRNLGLITSVSLLSNLVMLPCIIAGGIIGIVVVHRINDRLFNRVVRVLAGCAAVVLCVRGILSFV